MNEYESINNKDVKLTWVKPELIVLEQDASDIKNGFAIGNDGAGGVTTSLS